ncbi:hypothetical protein BH20CHL7_BH20CHL7_08100 [soil metagenome]
MNDRLYRSRDDRMLAGVAGGLADLWSADPSLVRIIWAVLVLFTGGVALIVYIVMALVVPEEDDVYHRYAPTADPPAGDAFTAAADPTAVPGTTPPPGPTGWTTPSGQDPSAARRAARAERRAARGSRGSSSAPLIGGIALILLGSFFLAREWLPQIDFDWFWPLILVGLGVVLLVSALGRDRGAGGAP